jgi:hypothetical protein
LYIQDLNMNIEIIKSIRNLLNSPITNKEIMESCELSNKTVSELRNRKKSLDTTSFSTISSLYWLAKRKKLDTISIELRERKGNYKSLPFEVDVKKVFVSFEKEDMFLNGVLLKQSMLGGCDALQSSDDTLTRLDEPQAVLSLSSGELIDAWKVGYKFLCRYGGTGPSDFVNTLQKYSAIPKEDLQEIVFNSSSVVYDALNDTIKGLPTIAGDRRFDLYSYKGRLVIKLNYLDNSKLSNDFSEARGNRKKNKKISLSFLSDEIDFFRNIMKEKYESDCSVSKVKYINDLTTPETTIYNYDHNFSTLNDYRLIVEFEDYELWIPYIVEMPKRFKGIAFDSEGMTDFLSRLDVRYEKQNVIKKLKPKESISVIDNKESNDQKIS